MNSFLYSSKRLKTGFTAIALLILLCLSQSNLFAQHLVRTYASHQETYTTGVLGSGSVFNASNAADGDPSTASTLSVSVNVATNSTATQYLEFRDAANNPRTIAANTPVTLKLNVPAGLVGVLSSLTLQPFNGLVYNPGTFGIGARWQATAAGSAFTNVALSNVISGAGIMEVTITPTVSYQGVWITLYSTVALGLTADVYHAYIKETSTTPVVNCNDRIDVLSGVGSTASNLSLLSGLGSVTNPWNAVDNDTNTAATIYSGTEALGYAYETVIFRDSSHTGDSVRIILSNSTTLLTLSALNGFTIQAYKGNTAVGAPLTNTGNLLRLTLLAGSVTPKYTVVGALPSGADRVQIRLAGVANVLASLNIHDVSRAFPTPTVVLTGLNASGSVYAYYGQGAVLTATPVNADGVIWYNAAGTALSTANPYTTAPITADVDFKVAATRNGCAENSPMVTVHVKVITLTPSTPPVGTVGTAYTATLTATPSPAIGAVTYTYSLPPGSTLPAGLTLNSNGTISGTPTTAGTYNVPVKLYDVTNGLEAGTITYTFIVRPPLALPASTLPAATLGGTYSTTIPSATGGSGVYTYAVSPSTPLPPGLSFNPATRQITGTPTTRGNYTFTINVTDNEGRTTSQTFSIQVNNIEVTMKVLLQGAALGSATSGTMRTDLAAIGILPTSSTTAYPTLAAKTQTDINTKTINGKNIVDWVYVELRSSADVYTTITAQAGLLLSDGTIVDATTGTTSQGLSFDLGSYAGTTAYVSVRHRNHVTVVSANPISLSTAITYDFTTGLAKAMNNGNGNSMVQLGTSGIWAMWPGDLVHDEVVDGVDRNLMNVQFLNGYIDEYREADITLDGAVDGVDRNLFSTPFLLSILSALF